MKKLIGALAVSGALFLAGRATAPQSSAAQTTEAQWVTVIRDGSPVWVQLSAISATPTELPTPTPIWPSTATAAAQPSATRTATAWPTPTKVPSFTPSPTVTAQYTNTPDPGCEGYPCWIHVDQTYIVVNKVWLCLGASPCGSVPENQSRLRDVGETVHVLCLFEEARGGNLWASELACGGSYWSALKYAGRVYMQLK